MTKNKRKVTATTTRGKAILRSSVVNDHDQDRSTILALQAFLAIPPCSSSSVLQPAPPPSACALCPAILPPIPKVAPVLNTLETVTIEDSSADEGLDEALLEEEQLDFSFTNDDGCPPFTVDVRGVASPTNVVAGTSLTFTPGSRDFQPQFEVWNLCVVGYVSGKSPGHKAHNGIISSVWKCENSLTIHDSGWLIYRFTREEDKLSVLSDGTYLVYGKPLILHPMTRFFYFSSEEMSRVSVWVRFPNLSQCCWSPSCLSKIASVLGKTIQSDHMTSTFSRLSYAYVLVEIDLCEELQHFVAVSLPSRPTLHQKAIYEALPKFYNYCNVLEHTRLLCPKAAANATKATMEQTSSPLDTDPTKTVIQDNELAPCVASKGWIAVEPRRKSNKHIHGNPKVKEVIAAKVVSDVNPCVDSGTTNCLAPLNLGEGSPNDGPSLEELAYGCSTLVYGPCVHCAVLDMLFLAVGALSPMFSVYGLFLAFYELLFMVVFCSTFPFRWGYVFVLLLLWEPVHQAAEHDLESSSGCCCCYMQAIGDLLDSSSLVWIVVTTCACIYWFADWVVEATDFTLLMFLLELVCGVAVLLLLGTLVLVHTWLWLMVGFTGILVCWLEFLLAITTPFHCFLCSQARLLGWKLDVGSLDLLIAFLIY
ncbi:hypothetical protein NC653_031983 [Populus alba x Populus x berolinensis]|uniref:DUF4283 domain-containing protein n=2 Tax=Populus TaxID=3689 RepID=A0A4U5Q9P3_POPAL|nr:hypothetical protein NC653_031983 [Populus alba x Populus x berolinensis]TKS06662.1 hypothetical protein D5086_0000120860 [Populus alba]